MSQTIAGLQRKTGVAGDLQGVVRTMKAMAASRIGQYENSMRSLSEYHRWLELGLSQCSSEVFSIAASRSEKKKSESVIGVVVFGSDQGLVGQFNEVVAEHAVKTLSALPGDHRVWSVGESIHVHLNNAGLDVKGNFPLPKSVAGITPLIGQILLEVTAHNIESECDELHLVYNHKTSGTSYQSVSQQFFPLDSTWLDNLGEQVWPTHNLPELIGGQTSVLTALIREYLFVSIFRACTESLTSENASRLAAMQRADKNIDELLENLRGTFHRLRQDNIDEELFDVISGFEALSKDMFNA